MFGSLLGHNVSSSTNDALTCPAAVGFAQRSVRTFVHWRLWVRMSRSPERDALVALARVALQKSHQCAFNLSKSVAPAAPEERLLQFPLLVRLDDAGMNVARSRDSPRVSEDFTRFVGGIDNCLCA